MGSLGRRVGAQVSRGFESLSLLHRYSSNGKALEGVVDALVIKFYKFVVQIGEKNIRYNLFHKFLMRDAECQIHYPPISFDLSLAAIIIFSNN